MDHFGIGAGIQGALRTYLQSGRRTGRTVSLIESVKDGDTVVFLDEREARRVQKLCRERGVEIEIAVSDTRTPERLFSRPSPSGSERTIFDHSWVEEFYMDAVNRARKDIDHLQTQLSGRGEPHRGTKRQAHEMAKWNFE